jgi:hypothetical protein
MTNVIRACSKAPRPTWATHNAAASEEKKTDDGTMMWPSEAKSNPWVAAEPPDAQTLAPSTT